jgi:hypothetical protein
VLYTGLSDDRCFISHKVLSSSLSTESCVSPHSRVLEKLIVTPIVIPRLSCNLKSHYHVYNSPTAVSILSQMNPAHILTLYILRSNLKSFYQKRLCLPSGPCISVFLPKIVYAFLISHMHATFLAHLIFLQLIALITFLCGEQIMKLITQFSPSSYNFLCPLRVLPRFFKD